MLRAEGIPAEEVGTSHAVSCLHIVTLGALHVVP
jgi:hypothetical protein